MKYPWHLALCAALILAACAPGLAQPGDAIYVSIDGNDTWSGALPEPNAGGTDGPVRSLPRARDLVRGLIADGLSGDVQVSIREGRYYLDEELVLGPEDSGTEQHSVTYAAYPGEEVWLIGGVVMTGWTASDGEILEAPLPEGIEPRQVFENGRRLELARTPDTGYYRVETVSTVEEDTAFAYHAEDISAQVWDVTGASVYVWPTHDWSSTELPIRSVDPATRTIRLAGKTGAKPDNRYFVRNVLAELDRPGECRIDLEQRRVYLWPRATPIKDGSIVAGCAGGLVGIRGGGGGLVRNVHLRDLNLSIVDGTVIGIAGARGCSVRSCLIENAGGDGISVTGGSRDIAIAGNLIRYIGASGVQLSGLGAGEPGHGVRVENNHIHHCGQLVGHGAGVYVIQSGHNVIAHNHIHHMLRYGTSIKGGSWGQATWETHWDHLHARNNVFSYNHIHDVNLDTQDTGAMECFLAGKGNVYDHNLIHDSGNERFGLQSGIYIDDASDYFTVTHNVIYGIHGSGGDQCIYVKGIHNTIRNNILIVAPENESAIRSYSMGGHCDHHTYTHNIIVFEGEWGSIYDFNDWIDERVSASDYNLFWKPGGPLVIRGGPAKSGKSKLGYGSLDAWRSVFGNSFYRHSIVVDPLFVNPAQRDYRLSPESPAYSLGFEPVDTLDKAGLTPDFPKRLETFEQPLETVSESRVIRNRFGMKLILIEPGAFTMGSTSPESDPDEEPVHGVTITRPFYLGMFEVTQKQYQKLMGANPSRFRGPNLPVGQILYADAVEFCRRLSANEGVAYRLPTEAEWEYACRAGATTAYFWGDEFDARYAWASPNSGGTTHEVGTRLPNPWGLYDMSGNVWEWCADWYADRYPAGPQTDPMGAPDGTYRVLRGGDWEFGPRRSRSAQRYWQEPAFVYKFSAGFRVARDVEPAPTP